MGSISLALAKSDNFIQTKADEYNAKVTKQEGLFERVTSKDQIVDGESYLLIGGGNQTLQFSVGASGYTWMTTEFSSFNLYSEKYIYAQQEKGELVTFERSSGDTYYLKLKHFVNWAYGNGAEQSGYIVHEQAQSSFGDLFFRTSKDSPSKSAATWDVSFENGYVRLVSKTDRLLVWKSSSSSYMWNAFIASTHTEWESHIRMYRYIGKIETSLLNHSTAPSRTTYNTSDVINLHGLSVIYGPINAIYYQIFYDDAPRFFSCNTYFDDLPVQVGYLIHYTFLPCPEDDQYFTIDISVSTDIVFSKVYPEMMNDIQGTYIIVAENARKAYYSEPDAYSDQYYPEKNGKAVSLDDSGINFQKNYGKLFVNNLNNLYLKGKITIAREYNSTRGYVNKVFNNSLKSLHYTDSYTGGGWNSYMEYYNDIFSDPTVDGANLFLDGYAFKYDTEAGKFLLTNSTDSKYELCVLYRLEIGTEIIDEINYFRTQVFDYKIRAYCNEPDPARTTNIRNEWGDGKHTKTDTVEHWFYQGNSLSVDARSYIVKLTYVPGNVTPNTPEAMVELYDYLVTKYDLPEFMCRREADTLAEKTLLESLHIFTNTTPKENGILFVIIAITAIGVTGAALILVKKKKRR